MKKTRPPCIRNLEQFKKTGCPEQKWDGQNGCPAWKEMIVALRANPEQRELKAQCIDLWNFEHQWALLGTTEGTQQATEAARNMTAALALSVAGKMGPEQLAASAAKYKGLVEKEN